MTKLLYYVKDPFRLIFYGYVYMTTFAHLVLGHRMEIQLLGTGHTRPNLTWKMFRILGLREVGSDRELAYYHEDATLVRGHPTALNGRCTDISKSNVGRIFAEIAGYDLDLDPRTHSGTMVRKSETNSEHDGLLMEGPVADPDPGYVYQRLIDNRVDDRMVCDIRPCIVGGTIPFVYLHYSHIDRRFSHDCIRTELVQADAVLSQDEQRLILRFAKLIGLDVGEIDVLRDRDLGCIYIVDVAKTPCSPSPDFLGLSGLRAMHLAADAFRQAYLGVPRPELPYGDPGYDYAHRSVNDTRTDRA